MSEQEVQQKYMELQMISSQLKQVQQQVEVLSHQIVELSRVNESLEDISKAKKGTDIMAPLGSGIFIKASLKETKEVLLNVGGEIMVNKNTVDAKTLVSNQIEEMTKIMENLQNEYAKGATRAQEIQMEMQSMMAKAQKSK